MHPAKRFAACCSSWTRPTSCSALAPTGRPPALLSAPALSPSALQSAFAASVEPPSAKDRMMDQAAFIVYYEETRYRDTRLEPQAPSRRAEQNGLKLEALRAIEDERTEIQFLLKQPPPSVEGDDGAELREYSAAARRALRAFLDL